ncbi:gp436 [Bacillus phage G]|uniref:Gp436 n=1 Tax=Bacillus phage G TaxID=2884420 RepID=G3MAH7_9CAUD|nr:gp436 [Bacillus phage G]AEO93694.1 gp436 [Bacillus phage G]
MNIYDYVEMFNILPTLIKRGFDFFLFEDKLYMLDDRIPGVPALLPFNYPSDDKIIRFDETSNRVTELKDKQLIFHYAVKTCNIDN